MAAAGAAVACRADAAVATAACAAVAGAGSSLVGGWDTDRRGFGRGIVVGDVVYTFAELMSSAWLWAVGAAVGIGQVLSEGDPLCWRRILGRALVAGGLGVGAGSLLMLLPEMPYVALLGAAAAAASLGAGAIERVLIAWARR